MRSFNRSWTGVAAVITAAVLSGCGGGGGGASLPDGNRFAGNYTGTFSGTSAGGPVSGRAEITVDNSGTVTGKVIQDGSEFTATGTIDTDTGAITITAGRPVGQSNPFTSTLTGNAGIVVGTNTAIATGTFSTVVPGNAIPVVTGRFAAIRAGASSNPFAGNYTGSFNGTTQAGGTPISGTFTANIDANGSGLGTVTQPGVGTFPASAIITPQGQVLIAAVGNGFISTLSGNATLQNGTAGAAGNFTTVATATNQVITSGTFTATRS